jgi:hypothetical protein
MARLWLMPVVTVIPSLVLPVPQRAGSRVEPNLSRRPGDVGFRQQFPMQNSNMPARPRDSADTANPRDAGGLRATSLIEGLPLIDASAVGPCAETSVSAHTARETSDSHDRELARNGA